MAALIISNIQMDKACGWASNYYRDTEWTPVDVALARAEQDQRIANATRMNVLRERHAEEVAAKKMELAAKEAALDKSLSAAVAAKDKLISTHAARDEKSTKAFKKANPTADETAIAMGILTVEDRVTRKEQLAELQVKIDGAKAALLAHQKLDTSDLEITQKAERVKYEKELDLETTLALVDLRMEQVHWRQRNQAIQNARNQFMVDADMERLKAEILLTMAMAQQPTLILAIQRARKQYMEDRDMEHLENRIYELLADEGLDVSAW
jgi:hypothetical protein